MFCELLDNTNIVYKYSKKFKGFVPEGEATTINIAKWLRLASQIDSVELNPFRYKEAHFWCESAGDELDSDAGHHKAIITPITQFMFIANALEETYRFISSRYEHHYKSAIIRKPKLERKRNYSAQAHWLLDEIYPDIEVPEMYKHKVDSFTSLAKSYQKQFNVSFDFDLENNPELSHGLSIVRNIRNHIAHAVFPIIENPEYTLEFSNPKSKRLILNLLAHASRVAAMNIQMMLSVSNSGFNSAGYSYLCSDPDYGNKLESLCTLNYLKKLHIKQEFGLNESSQWQLRSEWGLEAVE
ncbi:MULTISPECIES: hypothetical protein [unclassified Pseudoalteromonas]|uniref:hypothetical protein n=1 Tax=unclassified Pseudoalteromonas TaxID=194690 RepID=UPI0011AE659D|nr:MULTISPECIES: hypothetical protein [unclassified Pseudoalteromonas]